MTTRLAIDELRSARARRQRYVGVAAGPSSPTARRPAQHAEIADSLSLAMLVLLKSLSPEQRAVLLLHDVFDYGSPEIATIVGKSQDSVRQLATRADAISRSGGVGGSGSRRHAASAMSWRDGSASRPARDIAGLEALLAHEVVLTGDGGGKVPAAHSRSQGAAVSRTPCSSPTSAP